MRRMTLLAALCLSTGVAFGQEKFDFTPRVKSGDVFASNCQSTEKGTFEPSNLLHGSSTMKAEVITTLCEVQGGKPIRFEEKTIKYEVKTTGAVAGISLDGSKSGLQGITIRYEKVGENFESTLAEGDLKPEVAEKLRETAVFPLNENFLPTKPLAVGESEVMTDLKRLGWEFKDKETPVKFEEKPTITLEKVATIDGVKTAFLKLSFKGRAEVTTPSKLEAETFQCKATILFDLDHGYVTRIEIRDDFRVGGEINGKKGIVTVEKVTVNRYQKK